MKKLSDKDKEELKFIMETGMNYIISQEKDELNRKTFKTIVELALPICIGCLSWYDKKINENED